MRVYKYKHEMVFNHGTDEIPYIVRYFVEKESIDEEDAIKEAFNGEYTIEDIPDEPKEPTMEQRISDLEEQIIQADETAITLYEAQEAQDAINAQQDEALMEIYEMIG